MVNFLTAPASLGSMGVLHNHAPLLTTLETGLLSYKKAGLEQKPQCIAIDNGLMEVNDNHVLILVQAAEKAQEIDLSRAEAARTRAKGRLAAHSKDVDVPRAEASLKRALNR
ncbi:MAG: ATP synthase F1 subunit epsilon, partial [Clostridiales bacterium]|nr:ATP synthase F1 subunit epsilon [Clostridiales bacterium]